ncbi:NAD-dependent epimerase/dehydratase family protein [Niallia sp. XMNu-256]|uniref:NAD-dependent epimerase/dehydratase family protein n=1 Tax=Niallia sp. XMNu-256 TaxID=3082444 RepID=UPI0030CECF1E
MQQKDKPVLVTGSAGFIGFHLSERLLNEGYHVLGLDNLNDYYDPQLKHDRLDVLKKQPNFTFIKGSLENLELLESLFDQYDLEVVVHLAAQAGVRYSLTNPHAYIQSNLVGFTNLLECCKKHQISHFIYASSSSVYGGNKKIPFSVSDRTDEPVSLYAATKKANELLAHTYSHLYRLPTTGLRFFTVYGPWGRPDMAIYSFTKAMIEQKPIDVYNYGDMQRDFTYIDDVIQSIFLLIKKGPPKDPLYKVYNIGNNKPVQLNHLIHLLEKELGIKAEKRLLPIQPGDVHKTYADIDELIEDIHFQPNISIEKGIKRFIQWYKQYYNPPMS